MSNEVEDDPLFAQIYAIVRQDVLKWANEDGLYHRIMPATKIEDPNNDNRKDQT